MIIHLYYGPAMLVLGIVLLDRNYLYENIHITISQNSPTLETIEISSTE